MPSPFPGVDPYIEACRRWQGFHSRFINSLCEAIEDVLPPNYDAEIDERLRLVNWTEDGPPPQKLPDVAVVHGGNRSVRGVASGGAATLVPVEIPIPARNEVRERRIEIMHLPDQQLVTVIEVLSPTNKRGGREDYENKRSAILFETTIHLVELDFLVTGRRVQMGKPLPPGDCYAIVARGDRRAKADVYAWSLRDKLPSIPVPLKAPDPDVFVDLGAAFSTAYERGRYLHKLSYSTTPDLPLAPDDLEWIAQVGRSAAR